MPGRFEDEIENTQKAREIGILVLDGSESMGDPEDQSRPVGPSNPSRAERVREVLASPSGPEESLFARFKRGGRVNETEFMTLVFDTWVEERLPLAPAKDIDLSRAYSDLDVLRGHGGRTNMLLALQEARSRAFSYADMSTSPPVHATILFMTDGLHNVPDENTEEIKRLARELQNQASPGDRARRPSVVLACAPYGEDADTALLEEIATPGYYQKCDNAEQLRAFFIRTMIAAPQRVE